MPKAPLRLRPASSVSFVIPIDLCAPVDCGFGFTLKTEPPAQRGPADCTLTECCSPVDLCKRSYCGKGYAWKNGGLCTGPACTQDECCGLVDAALNPIYHQAST